MVDLGRGIRALGPTLALSAVIAFGIAGPAKAAAKLSAPVVHEHFMAQPCTGTAGSRTDAQVMACEEQFILDGDRTIDALNRKIFALLPTTSSRRDFITGHNAWVAYRGAFCASNSDAFQGGSAAALSDADCAGAVNTAHIAELRQFLLDLTQD